MTLAAVVGGVYAALTCLLPGPSYGPVQLRVAEGLAVLPYLFPAAAPGLTAGCLVANLLSPYGPFDLVVGTAATGLAALLTRRARSPLGAIAAPVVCNGVLVGGMLAFLQTGVRPGFFAAFLVNGGGVALGELAACGLLGGVLLRTLPNIPVLRDQIPAHRLPKQRE